ncbi:hypothetical protein FRC04_006562 [Tulasnella sp. 424]|nr:hypothetical protein FRC04_006562 [Tulasnella sp. 424]KAG8980980.1 hypothetical protein FRC05_003879 [Tulasnella sp. 425]
MADLLAYQFDDADDGEATAKSREDRKRRAFLDSKSSYPQEPVVLFPGWFMKSTSNLEDFSAEYDAKDVVLAVQHLYLRREYSRALNVSLAVMESMVAVDTSCRKTSSHSRELQDLALRSAIKTNQREIAAQIADRTRARWEAMPGSAASASEAYLLVNRPRDAISALLITIQNRPHLHRYVLSLAKAFEMLHDQMELAGLNDHESISFGRASTSLVRSLRAAAKRGAALEGLSPLLFGTDRSPVGDLPLTEGPADELVSDAEVTSYLKYSAFSSDQTKQILELRAYGCGEEVVTADEAEALRSVRSL